MKNKNKFQSKIFSLGHNLLALALAVRGVPRTWQPEEQPVTRASGGAIYEPELMRLDAIDPDRRIFQSGVLAAALITVAIDPAMMPFWKQLQEERWSRQSSGEMDAVGWLLQEILRHSGNSEIALRPDYQHRLFQMSLAAALLWLDGRKTGEPVWLDRDPPRKDIQQLLEWVRLSKGLRRTVDGFRPQTALTGRIPNLAQTIIVHSVDPNLAFLMAEQVAQLEEYAFDTDELWGALSVLKQLTVPAELAAPGALAACLVSLVKDPTSIAVWQKVFAGSWSHNPQHGSDIAGLITRSIQRHNRRCCDGVLSQAQLFARIMMALKSDARRGKAQPDPRAHSIPRARPVFVERIVDAWWKLPVPDGPQINLSQVLLPVLKGHASDQPRPACQKRRGRGRDRTGHLGERAFVDHHQRCSFPRAGKLIDRTRDQCGWDFELVTDSEPLWVFEVKVVGNGELEMTERQWLMAEQLRDRYWLVLVRQRPNADEEMLFIRDPFAALKPRKDSRYVVQTRYKVKARQWTKAAKRHVESPAPAELTEPSTNEGE